MRAVLATADLLGTPDGPAALEAIEASGLQPVILQPPDADGHVPGGHPVVRYPPPGATEHDEGGERLSEAMAAADLTPTRAFLICRKLSDALRAEAAGCRPLVVLGDRSADELYGPRDPSDKGMAVAPDLSTAVRYIANEAEHEAQLGPFPYDTAPTERPYPQRMPSSRELVKVFGVVIVSGIAVALGIAYWLQELYQTYQFPEIAYWVTLQFIPQAWRGLLFILIGAGSMLVAQRIMGSITGRRRYR